LFQPILPKSYKEDSSEKKPQLKPEQIAYLKDEPILNKNSKDFKNWQWTFSFRFWDQIKYFGLDTSEKKWFISLLERLKGLSKEKLITVLEDANYQRNIRYHTINWKQTNIPISREDLNWIDTDYLENGEEYEFYQFQLSTGKGRIVGFWDENLIFNIVLLDPLHNMQPSKNFGYKVDDCKKVNCEYSSLLYDIKNAKTLDEVKLMPYKSNSTNVMMHHIDDDTLKEVEALMKDKKIDNIEELLTYGIMYCEENL